MKRRNICAKEQRQLFKSNRKNICQTAVFLAIKGTLYANSWECFQTILPVRDRSGAAFFVQRGR
jgi:hypothetical protein